MKPAHFNCYLYQVASYVKEDDSPIAGFLMWSDGRNMQDRLNEVYRGIRFILTEVTGEKRSKDAA